MAPKNDVEQRIIDHEVRLGRAQAGIEAVRAARERRRQSEAARAEARWFREQYIAMLRTASSEQELHDLGLTDDAVREARLGDSLLAAWTRYRPPPRVSGDRFVNASTG